MKKKIFIFLFIIAAAFTASADDPRPFVVLLGEVEVNWDPHHSITMTEAQLYTACYEGLLNFHPQTLEIKPGIASEWEVSKDKKTYTFFLNKDARFSNGDRVTAPIIRDSWLRLISPEQNADYSVLLDPVAGAKKFREGSISNPKKVGIKAVNDNILEITLRKPAAHFIKMFSHHSLVPVHPDNLKDEKWKAGINVIGNGPFKLKSIDAEKMVFVQNEFYWDVESLKITEIQMILDEDEERDTRLFNYGLADWVHTQVDMESITQEMVQVAPQFGVNYFFFNAEQYPYNKALVRAGLAYMLDWSRIRSPQRYLFPTDVFVPALIGYPSLTGIQNQDISLGRKLLYEAGHPDGKGLSTLVIKVIENSTAHTTAEIMKENWKKYLDIEVRIEVYTWDYNYNAYYDLDFTLTSTTWIGDYGDPLTFLLLLEGNSNLNDANYKDPEFDRLIEESMSLEKFTRYRKLAAAEQILLDDAIILPIFQTFSFHLIDLEVIGGWYNNVLDIHPYKYIEYKDAVLPDDIVMLME